MQQEKPLRILVVEDDVMIATDIEQMLGDFGDGVCGLATDAGAALGVARQLRPDLVITDVDLAHGSNGLDLARAVYPQLRIPSFISSARLHGMRFDDLPLPPLGTLGKPFEAARLRRALIRIAAARAAAVPAERR